MPQAMDNFLVHVIARDPETIADTLRFFKYPYGCSWGLDKDWLVFFSSCKEGVQLPIPLDINTAQFMIKAYLASHDPVDPEPNIDGHCTKGFEIKSGTGYEILRVRPIWAIHHK